MTDDDVWFHFMEYGGKDYVSAEKMN